MEYLVYDARTNKVKKLYKTMRGAVNYKQYLIYGDWDRAKRGLKPLGDWQIASTAYFYDHVIKKVV